jgi:hypothetical protein
MTQPDDFLPFRWNIAKRNELGSLVEGRGADLKQWLAEQLGRSAGAYAAEIGSEQPADWYLLELFAATACILGQSGDGELFFVGRSPENFHDFLSGVFKGKASASRIHLLPFSVGASPEFERTIGIAAKRRTLERNLSRLGLAPRDIMRRRRPTVLVDIVASGRTLGHLVAFLHTWCARQGEDWKQLRRKLRIVGLTGRTKTSPKTRRWHQHAKWTGLLPRSAIKNVSIPRSLFHYLGAGQAKLNASFAPERWGDDAVLKPPRDEDTKLALRLARVLHVMGQQKELRRLLARLMATQPAARYGWFRALMREVIAP